MYNISLRILNNADEAADVLQESFIQAFERLNDFRQETTFGLWIKQIVVNKSISQLRKRRVELVPIEEIDDFPEEESVDYDEIEYQVKQVKEAIKKLPDGYRIVLSLYLLEGYDHEEISSVLKISENTSRTQFMRAKRKLIEIIRTEKVI
ncbi:MAG: polymerase subunit sigma-24 [Sphingobacteriales bacterium]|nr:polymerase subunit sigma-24 [Sphingobacteriales bacterium]